MTMWRVALVLVLLLLRPAPASAGEATTLREASPASGETIATMPDFVRLTFTDIVTAPRIEVAGPGGQLVNSSPISPRGNTVIQPVQPVGPGVYTVRWEVTGADGAPASGSYTFTLTGTESVPPDPPPATDASTTVSEPAAAPAPAPTGEVAGADSVGWWPFILAGGAAAIVIGGFLVWYRRRAG